MYVRRIEVEDLRGFRKLSFSFERSEDEYAGWVVITGDNGSGKSALLKAVALCLIGPDIARSLQPSTEGWVRSGAESAMLSVEVQRDGEVDVYQEPGRTTERFWAELEIVQERNARGTTAVLRESRRRKKVSPARGPWAANPLGWFCAGYGPFRRLYGSSEDAARLASAHGPVGRFVTLFQEAATLQEAERWLKELDHRRQSGNDEAEQVLSTVERLLNAEFLHQGLRVDRVDPDGVWLRDEAGVVLPMRDMSDGYRAALALLADILRHMVEVYGPHGLLQEEAGRLQVGRPGVVLIDEIDAHLHPEWQRHIGFWLTEHFPRVQFVVTSHSPLICQAASERMIFHLPPPGSGKDPFPVTEDDYRKIVRSRPDQILLTPVFNLRHTRSPLAVEQRSVYSRLAAKRRATRLTEEEGRQLKLALRFVDEDAATD